MSIRNIFKRKNKYEATSLYRELLEEFEKGRPDSDVNQNCNTKEDVAVYAMKKYASQKSLIDNEFFNDIRKIMAIILVLGGIVLGLCSVSGWGWLIFLAVLILDSLY